MDGHKAKLKIGSHEIEVEGASKEEIDERLALFKDLVLAAGASRPQPWSISEQEHAPTKGDAATNGEGVAIDSPYAPIFKIEGKTVSLTTPPQGQNREGEAFILLLFGQKLFRKSDWVLVGDVKAGLIDSGFSVDRVADITAAVSPELFMKRGQRMGKQFRLTNPGIQNAQKLAQEILANVS